MSLQDLRDHKIDGVKHNEFEILVQEKLEMLNLMFYSWSPIFYHDEYYLKL